ncbi:hypothetical protein D3C72_2261560 [compost metagenome]
MNGDMVEFSELFLMISKLGNLQAAGAFNILKKLGFLVDGRLLPLFNGFRALHHFGGLMTNVSLV